MAGERQWNVTVCVEIGTGSQLEPVTTMAFPSDPEMALAGARSAAAVRAQACPAPSSLLVL
ncbi:MAG TPA: hypothetical protein VKM54_24505 [Myxococcota bacterium]|nr:hypothetical protein [Myxococcota bacterium]